MWPDLSAILPQFIADYRIWLVFGGLAVCWLLLLPQGRLRRRRVR